METKRPLLLIFCKAPVRGKVKTRLAKTIGDNNALKIYQQLLHKTAEVVQGLEVDLHIWYSDHLTATAFHSLQGKTFIQQGDDLGTRMARAFKQGFATHQKVIIIGTDLWSLQKQMIHTAIEQLDQNDAVVGPSTDGGYYLLGTRNFIPQLFENKSWSTSTVLSDTLKDLTTKKVYLLEEKTDIDTYEDVLQFPELMAVIDDKK